MVKKQKSRIKLKTVKVRGFRKLNGKRFVLAWASLKKDRANFHANNLRKAGYNARIVKSKTGHDVFRSGWKRGE